MLYHAKDQKIEAWSGRTTRVQPFRWTVDGTPDFGQPILLGVPLSSPSD